MTTDVHSKMAEFTAELNKSAGVTRDKLVANGGNEDGAFLIGLISAMSAHLAAVRVELDVLREEVIALKRIANSDKAR